MEFVQVSSIHHNMRPARSAVKDSTVHGTTLCKAMVCAEDFLLPDCVDELALGLELALEPEPEPVLLLPVTVVWPEIYCWNVGSE